VEKLRSSANSCCGNAGQPLRGLVLVGPETIEFRPDVPDPGIESPGDVIVAVGRAGLCGSDLHPYHGREPVAWGIVPGHEASGEIVEVGADVRQFARGDRVFLPFTTSCGTCQPCLAGLSARCDVGQLFGWASPDADASAGLGGTQAEFVRVPLADTTLLPLPAHLGLEAGVLLGDNFTTGYYCARRGGGSEDGLVVVIGCGAVGLSALVSARHFGAGRIMAVDPVPSRRETALRLGADLAVVPDEAAAVIAGLPSPDDRGARVVLEAVGNHPARQLCVELVAPGGTISSVGVATDRSGFASADLYDRNLTLRAGRCPVRSLMTDVMAALDGGHLQIPISDLIAEPPFPLEQGAEVYRSFAARSGPDGKPLLAP
jgi:alcohol dehydrogenase